MNYKEIQEKIDCIAKTLDIKALANDETIDIEN